MRYKWTPSARPGPSPEVRAAIEAPLDVVDAPARPPRRSIEETIPDMTDKELGALRENALRLASDNSPRRGAAERLLPAIEAELERRRPRAAHAPAATGAARRPVRKTAKAK